MKPLVQLAAVGVVAFSLWKVGSFFLLPVLFFVIKIALVVALVCVAYWIFKRSDKGRASDTPDSSSTSTST